MSGGKKRPLFTKGVVAILFILLVVAIYSSLVYRAVSSAN